MGKVRTQLQLDPADRKRIKSFAERRGISMASAIRMLLRQALGDTDEQNDIRWKAFLSFAGKGRDIEGKSDVAKCHDDYLYGGS